MNNTTLTIERIAIRPSGQHWQWFGPSVHFKFDGFFEKPKWCIAHCVIESMCREIVETYGFDFIKDSNNVRLVEAPSERALELVDLRTL